MRYKRILCSVTGSEHGKNAALRAARSAMENDADLIYVYVVDLDFMRGGIAHMDVETALMRIGKTILKQAEEVAVTEGVTPRKIIRKGSALEVLRNVIREEKADLLVLSHEKRTFFEKTLLGGDVEDHLEELRQETQVDIIVAE